MQESRDKAPVAIETEKKELQQELANITTSKKAIDIQSSIKPQQELSAQLTNAQSKLAKAQAQEKLLEIKYQAKAKKFVNNITNPQFATNLSENITLHKQLKKKIEVINHKVADVIALELTEGIWECCDLSRVVV